MPLDYMLSILRDVEQDEEKRRWAAQQAAPYCHPRLTTIDAKVWAELHANVQHAHVIDVRHLDLGQREILRGLLQGIANDEPGEGEGAEEVQGGELSG